MMAASDAKDGPSMFSDWLSYLRNDRLAAATCDTAPEPDAVQALAAGVLQLCTLCEELVDLVPLAAAPEAVPPVLSVIPAQIAAVRACADEIQCRPVVLPAVPMDPYSLAALGEWVWRE